MFGWARASLELDLVRAWLARLGAKCLRRWSGAESARNKGLLVEVLDPPTSFIDLYADG